MKDFKSYQKNNSNKGNTQKKKEETVRSTDASSVSEETAAELTRKALAAYNGKSQSSVLLEILRQAEAGKRAGTLTDADIDAFYAQFSPMLSKEQRKKLQSVLAQLKRI